MSKPKQISSLRFLGLLLLVALFALFVAHLVTGVGPSALPGSTSRETSAREAAEHAANIYRVDPDLILAVMWKESRFNAKAKGKAGEIGLMQLMPNTAAEWAEKTLRSNFQANDLYDPKINAEAGTWYILRGMEMWNHKQDPLPYALARYNAGQSRVLKWDKGAATAGDFIDAIGIPSTKQYVRDVIDRYGKNIAERVNNGL